jgi:hypothetical protein
LKEKIKKLSNPKVIVQKEFFRPKALSYRLGPAQLVILENFVSKVKYIIWHHNAKMPLIFYPLCFESSLDLFNLLSTLYYLREINTSERLVGLK